MLASMDNRQTSIQMISWKPIEEGEVKTNTDGALSQGCNLALAGGGLYRTPMGDGLLVLL